MSSEENEKVAEEITQITRAYRDALEVKVHRAILLAVGRQGKVAAKAMAAVREKHGNAVVDRVLADFSADSDVWVEIDPPEGMPHSVRQIEARAASGGKPKSKPKRLRAVAPQPWPDLGVEQDYDKYQA